MNIARPGGFLNFEANAKVRNGSIAICSALQLSLRSLCAECPPLGACVGSITPCIHCCSLRVCICPCPCSYDYDCGCLLQWDAWNGMKGKSKEDAMTEYIAEVERQQREYA